MKSRNLVAVLVIATPFGLLLADDVPKPFTFARYQGMMDRSPFAVATAVVAAPVAPNFAKDLYVANAAHSKEGDYVTIASSADKNFKKYLSTNEAEDGYSITGIEWSDKLGATKVTIAKDGQAATLSFNEALLKQNATAGQVPQSQPPMQMPQPIVPQANVVAPNIQQQRPAPIPQLPTPPPRVRGVIPKNPAPVATPTPEVEL